MDEDARTETAARLEYLRSAIRAENISYGELAELQSLAEHIDPGDVELLEWAGVPEFENPWRVSAGHLAELLGSAATDADAEPFAALLTEAGYPTRITDVAETTDPGIPDDVWNDCLRRLATKENDDGKPDS